MSHDKCGTYAGYQVHKRAREDSCDPCRRANAEYRAQRRRSAEVREREYQQNEARRRAWSRLAAMHPSQYRALYEEELSR